MQAVLDDGFGVVRASAPGEQPAHQFLARDVEVYRSLHLNAERVGRGERRLGLFDRARESIQDIAADLGRGDDRFAQHIHDNAVRDQVAVVDIGLDRLPE